MILRFFIITLINISPSKIITGLILFLISNLLYSQELLHYDLRNGLSSSEITSICENEHYLWIATEDGLNRFDGHRFKIYKTNTQSNNSLKNNNIEVLYHDSKGLLWIGYKTGGVDIYNPKTERFLHLNDLVTDKIPNRIISIFEDSKHNIWLGSWEEGVYKLTPKEFQNQEFFDLERSHPGCIISSITEKPQGYIWISTYSGLLLYITKEKQWKRMTATDKAITQILNTKEETNRLYYSSWDNAIYKLEWNKDPQYANSELLYQNQSPIYRIESNKKELLIGTWGKGVLSLNKSNKTVSPLTKNEYWGTTFINSIYKDQIGNIWIGSYGKGLYKYIPSDKGISPLISFRTKHAPATTISQIQDNILMGTLGDGLFKYSLFNTALEQNYTNANRFKNHILTIEQNDDIVLVGHDGIGLLYSFKKKNPQIEWKEFAESNKLEKITTFFIDENQIWIGTKQDGLMSVSIDKENKLIKNYVYYKECGKDRINAITKTHNNQLLIASHTELYILNLLSSKYTKKKLIENEIVYSIIEDKKKNCWWIGTSNNLMKLTISSDGTTNITPLFTTYPLPIGAIKSLLLDNNDNLWFFIGEKVFCYTANSHIYELNISHLKNSAILAAQKIIHKGKEYILFSNTEQLIAIDIEKIFQPYDKTKLILTDLGINHKKIHVGDSIENQIILTENAEYTNSLELSYKYKWISFTFTEIGESNFCNKYLYRLKGFTDNWQYLDTSTPLTFSQLNPGNYILEITKYPKDKSLCWSMPITVTPPWWKTTIFYTSLLFISLLILLIVIYTIIRYYKKKTYKKIQEIETLKKEELLKEKESFFESLSHDLITPLSLILAPTNDMLRETNKDDLRFEQLSIINKNATFLSDLFTTILDFKRTELSNTKLNNRNIEIVSFCRVIVNAFNYLACSKNIQLSYNTNIQSISILIDNVKLERILYNLISNAIKYTPQKGEVSVSLNYQNKKLTLSVKDSGPGIISYHQQMIFNKFYREPQYNKENAPKGLGVGLYIVKKLVSIMKGEIELESHPSQGTTFYIKIPVEILETTSTSEIKTNIDTISPDNKATILLVEDNEEISKYLSNQLRQHFNTIIAYNGKEAFEYIDQYLPEIVISDIMMPQMNGLELCRKIKENPLYADIFVILLTAKISSEDELQGYKEGADIYIKKPFDTEAIISQIINILTTRQKRKEQLLKNLVTKEDNNIEFNSKEIFLQQAMNVIEENLDKADFNIEEFATSMNISKTILHKKFKMLIGQTPNQFIRAVRLKKASNLLMNSEYSISEIAYLTGFNQAHYFIKCFKEVYHETPKIFREKQKKNDVP